MAISVTVGKRQWSTRNKSGELVRNWVYQARWRSPEGKDMARSLKTQEKHQARNLAVEMEAILNQGVVEPGRKFLGWKDAWEQYYELHHSTKEAATLRTEQYSWTHFWGWCPVKRLDQVTPVHVAHYRDWCLDSEGGDLAARTTNDYMVRCGTIFNKLKGKGVYGGANPFSAVERPPSDTEEKVWLSPEEATRLLRLAQAAGRDYHLYVALGLYAGLRPKETLNIRWDWINWPSSDAAATGWICVPKSDGDFKVKNKRARNIPLAPDLFKILSFYRELLRAWVVAPQEIPKQGRYRWNPRKMFATLVREARLGERNVTPYTLRHTFASTALNAGCSHYEVMDWMGHKDIRTLQIYGHLKPDNPNIALLYASVSEGR